MFSRYYFHFFVCVVVVGFSDRCSLKIENENIKDYLPHLFHGFRKNILTKF